MTIVLKNADSNTLEAIKNLQQILSENRLLATEPEQEILARFSGFGGLKKFLDDDEKGNQELRNLVGQEKLLEIYASADTAFLHQKNFNLGLDFLVTGKNFKNITIPNNLDTKNLFRILVK